MTVGPMRHAFAMAIAIALVFGVRIQDIDLQPLLGRFDQRFFDHFTPYFPGIDAIETHEIFAPQNTDKKKIVFLGSSAIDSIGCDSTWSRQDDQQAPNVHYTCSITGQLNELLPGGWRAFNLARNGAKLTPELYVYARVVALKPDLVIFGDTFNYYMEENADAAILSPEQYAYMDQIFDHYPETMEIWRSYKATLQKNGWRPAAVSQPAAAIDIGPRYRASTDLYDLILLGLMTVRSHLAVDAMARPVALDPLTRAWTRPDTVPHQEFINPDPGFGYFQGIDLIAAMQRRLNKRTFFYFSPQWDRVTDVDYQRGLVNEFGGYLRTHGIPFASYVPMEMQPIRETYDGVHQTMMGNRRMAQAILRDLRQGGLVP